MKAAKRAQQEIEARTKFVYRVLEQIAVRGRGPSFERFQPIGSRMVLVSGKVQTGYIELWEIEAVVKELLERCAK